MPVSMLMHCARKTDTGIPASSLNETDMLAALLALRYRYSLGCVDGSILVV